MPEDSQQLHSSLKKIMQLSKCDANQAPDLAHWQTLLHFLNEHFNAIEKHLLDSTPGLSQKSLQEAQRIANIGSWTFNHLTDETYWSDQAYAIFNLDKHKSPANYQTFLSCIHPDDRQNIIDFHKESLQGRESYTINYRILTSDGKIKYIQEHSENTYDKNGVATFSSGTVQDLSAQKKQEEQLRRTQKMQALGNLAGGVAHDFNNLLGVMIGYAELLQLGQSSPEDIKLYTDNIISAGNRGAKLARRMLSFSQHDSSETQSCNVNDIILEEQLMLQKTLTSNIALVMELEKNIWLSNINQDDLRDVILNICINAAHAMPTGGKFIIRSQNISIREVSSDKVDVIPGDYIKLSFKDTGCGMDEKTLNQLFDPFFTTKGDKGSGLGMSQVYGFIKRSHGAIDIFSEPNKGTEIILYLPRHTEKNHEPQEDKNKTTKKIIQKQISILIVDDEKALCKLISTMLNNHAYTTFTANSAQQALEFLETNHVDILLSDVVMPNMNGYELAEKVHELYPEIKIQIMSGYSSDDNVHTELAKQLSQTRLHKPVSAKALLQAINKLLSKANSLNQ